MINRLGSVRMALCLSDLLILRQSVPLCIVNWRPYIIRPNSAFYYRAGTSQGPYRIPPDGAVTMLITGPCSIDTDSQGTAMCRPTPALSFRKWAFRKQVRSKLCESRKRTAAERLIYILSRPYSLGRLRLTSSGVTTSLIPPRTSRHQTEGLGPYAPLKWYP